MPALTLFVAACSSGPRPSIQPATNGAKGNSYRLLLPRGTQLILPNQASASELQAIAYNELDPARSNGRTVVLEADLQIVSPAYITERNSRELQLVKVIEDLKAEVAQLRNK